MGLVGFVINAGLLLVTALIADSTGFDLTVGDFPPRPDRRHDRRRDRRLGRPEPRRHRRAACRPATDPGALRRAARAVRDAALRHRPGDLAAAAATVRDGVPRPVAPPVLGQGERRAGGHRRGRRARLRRQRRVARRMGGRRAGGRARTTRITLEGIGKTAADLRAAAAAAAREGRPLRWVAIESRGRGGRAGRRRSPGGRRRPARRALPAQPGRQPRRRWPGWRSAPAASKFGMTETELAGGDRAGGGPGRAAPAARHPPPRRLAARRGRRLARRGPPRRWRWPRCGAARSRRLRHARRRRRVPGLRARTSRRPRRPLRRASCRRCSTPSRPIAGRPGWPIEPGRFLVARAGWLVARVLHVRDRGGRQVVLDAGHDRAASGRRCTVRATRSWR